MHLFEWLVTSLYEESVIWLLIPDSDMPEACHQECDTMNCTNGDNHSHFQAICSQLYKQKVKGSPCVKNGKRLSETLKSCHTYSDLIIFCLMWVWLVENWRQGSVQRRLKSPQAPLWSILTPPELILVFIIITYQTPMWKTMPQCEKSHWSVVVRQQRIINPIWSSWKVITCQC